MAFEDRGEQAFAITERGVDRRRRAADATRDRLHRQRGDTVGHDQLGRRGDRAFADPDPAARVAAGLAHRIVERPTGPHPAVDGRAGDARPAGDPVQRQLGDRPSRLLRLGHRGLDNHAVHTLILDTSDYSLKCHMRGRLASMVMNNLGSRMRSPRSMALLWAALAMSLVLGAGFVVINRTTAAPETTAASLTDDQAAAQVVDSARQIVAVARLSRRPAATPSCHARTRRIRLIRRSSI